MKERHLYIIYFTTWGCTAVYLIALHAIRFLAR
jgi:hypothetical protein